MTNMFESDRQFKVWIYTVSHRRLLLRSTMEGGLDSRIDVYFGGVSQMLLWPYYNGLQVAEANVGEYADYHNRFGEITHGGKLFVLAPNLGSFVIAGVMQWHEDDGGYRDPSHFGHFLGA